MGEAATRKEPVRRNVLSSERVCVGDGELKSHNLIPSKVKTMAITGATIVESVLLYMTDSCLP